jgi:hypothetical protein
LADRPKHEQLSDLVKRILIDESAAPLSLHNNTGVDVYTYDKMLPEHLNFLQKAKLDKFGIHEAWVVKGTNTQINYSTHGIYRYFGKFPAPIAAKLISDYTKPRELVIDPACGSGTTGVEALLSGRNSMLYDVNPLSVLISKVKTTNLSEKDLLNSISELKVRFGRSKVKAFETREIDLGHWFLPETIKQLSRLKAAISREIDRDLQDFLMMVFASVIRRVSRATTQQGRLFLDIETAIEDIWPVFDKSARKAAERVSSLPKVGSVKVEQLSLLDETIELSKKAPLVIYHPPYFNAYKYTSINSLEMGWLDFSRKETRKEEIREFFKVGKVENAITYIDDIVQSLIKIRHYTKTNGVVAMMIGDALMKSNHVEVTSKIIEKVTHIFEVEKTIVRIPRYTEATWASSQRRNSADLGVTMYDFLVIFRAK